MEKMRVKTHVVLVFAFLLAISLAYCASALTASIGNSRMVLRLDVNEEIEKSILVKNVNDVPVTISVFASGDLEKNVKLEDKNFTLNAGEERNVFFKIKAAKAGTTETNINIQFMPEEGNSVGLSATVIIIAGGSSANEDDNSFIQENETSGDSGFGFNPGRNQLPAQNQPSFVFSLSPAVILAASTFILVIILILLVIYSAAKTKPKKRAQMNV